MVYEMDSGFRRNDRKWSLSEPQEAFFCVRFGESRSSFKCGLIPTTLKSMTVKRIFFIIERGNISSQSSETTLFGLQLNDGTQTGDTLVNVPNKQFPSSSVTFSMLISEEVYKLVLGIERVIRWVTKSVLRPCLAQFRCLLW